MPSTRDILGDDAINLLKQQGHDTPTIIEIAQLAYDNRKALAPPKVEGFTDTYGVNGTQEAIKDSTTLQDTYQQNQFDATKVFSTDQKAIDAFDSTGGKIAAGSGRGFAVGTRKFSKGIDDIQNSRILDGVDPETQAMAEQGIMLDSNPNNPKVFEKRDPTYSDWTNKTKAYMNKWDNAQKEYERRSPEKTTWLYDGASMANEAILDPATYLFMGTGSLVKRTIENVVGGAISGYWSGYAEDKNDNEKLQNAAVGAVVTPLFSEAFRLIGKEAGKAWLGLKDRKVKEAQSVADMEKIQANPLFKDVTPEGQSVQAEHFDFNTYADEALTSVTPEVKKEVLNAVKRGDEKFDGIGDDVYGDVSKAYEIQKGIKHLQDNEAEIMRVDAEVKDLGAKLGKGYEDSVLSTEKIRKELLKKQGDGSSIEEVRRYINTVAKPSEEEMLVTHAINDGMNVENRFSGYKIIPALERSMQMEPLLRKSPEDMFASLQKAGFNEESATVLSDAYAKGDISLVNVYFKEKISLTISKHVTEGMNITPYGKGIEEMVAKEKAVNDAYDAQSKHLKDTGEDDVPQTKSEQAVQSSTKEEVDPLVASSGDVRPDSLTPEPKATPTLDEMFDTINANDIGGEKQAIAHKAQMQAWADGENVRLKEMGLEPSATADEMAKRYKVAYANRAPDKDELSRLLSIVSDETGAIKTKKIREQSHGWQDVPNANQYGQAYTRRMAGEKGLDTHINSEAKVLQKLKDEGYDALSPDEKLQIKNDVALMREHPDFKLKQEGDVRVDEDGMLYDSDGSILFQAKRLERTYLKQQTNGRMEVDTKKLIAHSNDEMPHPTVSKDDFIAQFKGKKYVDTPVGKVDVHLEYHWNHINGKNTTGQKRFFYGGTIEPTLRDPLFVVKKEDGSEVFFKPFKNGEDGFFVTSITKGYDGKLSLETHYDPSLSKINKLINVPEKDFLYWKFGAGKKTPPDKISLNRGHDGIIPQKLNQDIKGAYTIDKKLIEIFDAHDVSTLNYELGHRFLFTLNDAEKAIAERIFEVKNGKWSIENHEAFADAYARYIAEGKTPVKALQSIFERFKQFTLDILDNLRANNGGKMPKLGEDMETFFAATMGHEPSRQKLFLKMQDEGVLFQKGADERIAKIEDEAMQVQAEHAVEKSIKLHGGFGEPLLEMITAPLKKLQTKMIEGFDALGKVKVDGVQTVRVERVTLAKFKEETGIDASKLNEAEIFDDGFELAFGKDGKREMYRLDERNVYENSVGNTLKISHFDSIDEAVTEMIHLKNASEESSKKRAMEHMGVLSKLSKEEQVTLGKALDGDMESIEGMSAQLRPLYETYRKLIDDGAELLVRYGFLKEKGQITDYVRRLYLPYVIKESMLDKFRNTLFRSDGGFGNGVGGIGKRKEMSLDERIAKGQIFDASYVIPVTRMEQEKLLIRGKFYDEISVQYGSLEKLDGYGQVPNEPFKFGKLSGKYIPRQLYDAIVNAPEFKGGLLKIWQNMFSHIKVNKTVKIPFTHLWNINSNVETMILSHTSPLPIARSMAKGNWGEVVALGEKYGMIDNDQLKNALGEAVSKLDFKEGEKTGMGAMVDIFTRLGKELYMAEDSTLGRGFRWAYGWEDKIFKLTAMQDNIYKAKLEMYKQKHGDLSLVDEHLKFDEIDAMKLDAAQEYKAFKEANALFADYQVPLPKTWRVLDENVVPFLKYSIRSTPITIKLMMKNPMTALALNMMGGGYAARGAALAAGYAGLSGTAQFLGGLYKDMDDKAHEPYMAKNGTLFGFDLPDNLMGIDNWRAIGESDTHVSYLNQGRSQPGIRGDALDSILTFGMIGQALGYTTGVDLRTKREFYHDDDPASVKAKNALSKMIQDVSPGLIGTYGPKYAEALMYGQNIYGEPMSAGDVTLQGMGIRRVAKERAEMLKQKEITTKLNKYVNAEKQIIDAKKEHEKFISSKGVFGISKRKFDERVKTITDEKEEAKKEMDKLKDLKKKVDGWSPYAKQETTRKNAFDIGIDIGIKKIF